MATTTKTSTTTLSTTTLSTSQVAYSELTKGSYSVTGSTDSGDGIQARILCQPAGSNVFYSDTRLADGKLQIDMTKEVQYT